MYYCIKCKETHETGKDEVLFSTAFCHVDSQKINVGYCTQAAVIHSTPIHINSQHNKIFWRNRAKRRLLKI